MFLRLLVRLTEFSPWFRKRIWHRWYQYLAGYQMEQWRFMNYGYVSLDAQPSRELDSAEEEDRWAIQLYDYVVGDANLSGLDVLEVGCGRGGGASFVSRYHKPRRMTAVDYSRKVIKFCQKQNRNESLEFVHGNAESLPFDDAQFDAVINVESSHCYGSMPAFLQQVRRVLRNDGVFLHADFRPREGVEILEQQLQDSGLFIVDSVNITANVLEAMKRDNERKLRLIDLWTRNRLNGTMRQFAGVEGSEIHEGFCKGEIVYMHYRLQKRA